VRIVTGTSVLLLPTTFDMAWSSMDFNSYLPDAASAAVPVEESMNNVLQAPLQVQDGHDRARPHKCRSSSDPRVNPYATCL
jgi:hypothetical protein